MQINESLKLNWCWSDFCFLLSAPRVLIYLLGFYFGHPWQYFTRRGGQEIILSLVTSCRDAEVPGGAALAVHAEAAQPRERERERAGQSQYYNLLQSLRVQPAQHSSTSTLHTTNSSSESEPGMIYRGFSDILQGLFVWFKCVEALCVFISNRWRM